MNTDSALVNERINALRPRLLNVTRRNPLIHNALSGRNRSYISIVDEKPQSILNALKEDASLRIAPLPIISEDDLPDEQTQEFKTAFANAVLVDENHRAVIEAIDFENDERAFEKQAQQERALKDEIREKLELPPRPEGSQHRDLVNHARILGINPSKTLPDASYQALDGRHEDDELQTLLLPETLQSRMSTVLSKQRIFEEERGVRVSYLVIGYLQWRIQSSDPKEQELKSPLILLPITFAKERSADGETYSISQIDEPQINPVLRHKLEVDLGLDLSELLDQINGEHLDVESFFSSVEKFHPRVASLWQVKREATLGLYPFPGIELHNDLRGEDIDFSSFSVLKELMLGKGPAEGSATDWSAVELDSKDSEAKVPHLVADADSSQHLALMKVASGENVALEGPPGSGKSQTIVNAIANALHEGKRVLFVAQKQTALEVVNARLQAMGLEKFVLPMVGSKSDTDSFYEALEQRLAVKNTRTPQQIATLRQKLEIQRSAISRYIDLLNRPVPGTELSIHQVLGLSMQHHGEINDLPLGLRNVSLDFERFSPKFDLSNLKSLLRELDRWAEELNGHQLEMSSPWADACTNAIDYDALVAFKAKAAKAAGELAHELEALEPMLLAAVRSVLDAHGSENIAEAMDLLTRWESSDDQNWSALIRNAEHAHPKLVDLTAFQAEAEQILDASSLPEETLLRAGNSAAELIAVRRFQELYPVEQLTERGVQQTIAADRERIRQLNDVQEQLAGLESSGVSVEPHRFLQARAATADLKAEQWLVELLATNTVDQVVAEMEQAGRSLAKIYEVLDENQVVPSLKQVKAVSETIKHMGFLGRFGRRYKEARAQAAAWLGQNAIPNRDRAMAVANLEQLSADLAGFAGLNVSEFMPQADSNSRSMLRASRSMLRDAQIQVKACGVAESHLYAFVTDPAVDSICSFLEAEARTDWTWGFLDKEISAACERLQFAESNADLLAMGERFCIEHTVADRATLDKVIAHGQSYLQLCARQEDVGRELKLEPCVPAKQVVEGYAALCSCFVSYCDQIRALFLDPSQGSKRDAIAHVLPFAKEVEGAVALVNRGKGRTAESYPVTMALVLLNAHLSDETGFNSLVQRRNILLDAERAGLGPLLSLLEQESLLAKANSIGAAAVVHSLKQRAERACGSELLLHSGKTLDGARSQLQEIDRELISLAPDAVSAAVVGRSKPAEGIGRGRKSEYTEMSLLKHELGKKRRTPPRKILKRARQSLTQLFPCWMMVPGAVAQHLPREECFDLVIIDEASQMTPENSISALMRAPQALISGDTNQLPPTDFFRSLSHDEDLDEDVSTDEESILELANTQFHPKHRLNWHYRSRHEDLISFSNHHVYDSDLTIFPSPNDSGANLGVSLVQVKGTFQRGLNLVEAEVMVEQIARFMRTNPDRSLGVVVMNSSQAEQLDSMVQREAQHDPAVAEYIDRWAEKNSGLEKFFVKNLENVQGDERDVIFIGTVYGADAQGKFYQRFGPINGVSGKRRLNVLFTRAKEQIVTFSSIPLEAFNPSSSNTGATLLKAWLQFSASGRLGGGAVNNESKGTPDSPFEEHVIAAIESLGFQAIPQVGESGYFIDIGVKHPDYAAGFLCGVECDGATYHSAKSARDRDRLRQEVLERLGWDLYRIWSTDWFRDPYGQTQLLKGYLEDLLAKKSQIAAMHADNVVDFSPGRQQRLCIDQELAVEQDGARADEEASNVGRDFAEDPVTIGSKVTIRYLNGARAGVLANFWLTDSKDAESIGIPGLITLRADSPLGEALDQSYPGDVVSYDLADEVIKVEIVASALDEEQLAQLATA